MKSRLLRSCFIAVVCTSFYEFLFEEPFNLGLVEPNAATDAVKWNLSLAAPMSDSPRRDPQKRCNFLDFHDFVGHGRAPSIAPLIKRWPKKARKLLCTNGRRRSAAIPPCATKIVNGLSELTNARHLRLFAFIRHFLPPTLFFSFWRVLSATNRDAKRENESVGPDLSFKFVT